MKKILAISGEPGLFKLVSEAKNGVVVESLITGKKMTVFSTTKLSSLSDISIYTLEADVPLVDVMKKLVEIESGEPTISHKSKPEEIKNKFKTILPEYDEDRVYTSDMKKVLQWYNILQSCDMLSFEEEESEEEEVAAE